MIKKITTSVALFAVTAAFILSVSFLAPNSAAATYISYTPYTTPACTDLSFSLRTGSTDALSAGQVSMLQSFLMSSSYLAIRVPTGYFGSATARALVTYQSAHGIAPSGYIDSATRMAIYSESCGGGYNTGYNSNYYNTYNTVYPNNGYYYDYSNSSPYNYNYGYNNSYNYGYSNNYYAVPTLTSLSPYSATVGSLVTIYGTGFDITNNTVNVAGMLVSNLPSSNGTSITFTVPQITNMYYPGYAVSSGTSNTYSVSVTTSHGTSNSLNLSVAYPYSTSYCNGIYYNGGYNNTYNGNCYNNNNSTQVSIYSVSPTSARTGTQVMLYGSGFTSYGNTVHFGNGGTMNLSSANGSNIYFTIPATVSGCDITSGYGTACPLYAQMITPGVYPMYVTNSYGQNSNVMYFTVNQY